ncbi:MAG: acyltransferase [Paracoccus sp. (in: a-proteobacteria)]|uniref:acyltransferase n=1 Tax=Paracoccus sp. TaxID=267 RepID=UPI0026DF542B|nr:acyltransferase [Paracoccus sp. (in: a-proteobacteria)]MDO5630905.1 acyltransferase [Paracoccus sp. (in: a-proteobacteria)]
MTDNSLVLISSDGSRRVVDQIDGLTVEFRGKGSVVEIGEGAVFRNSHLILSNRGYVSIAKTHPRGILNTTADMSGDGEGKSLGIGFGSSIEGCRFAMANETGVSITIGQRCMLSTNITFRGGDGHTIFDPDTRKVLNRTRPIVIGDHVWIGAGATLTKGSQVASHSVVATMAVVTRRFDQEHVAIAGNPAQIVRRGIDWDRRYIDRFV